MISISVRAERPILDSKSCQRFLERVVKTQARLASLEVAKQIPQNFTLKKTWAAKGMRYALESSAPNEAVASYFHKDSLMGKHTSSTIHGHLATPTKYALEHLSDKQRKPSRFLNLRCAFRDAKGDIWKREKKTIRKMFFFTSTHKYVDRLNLLVSVSNVAKRYQFGQYSGYNHFYGSFGAVTLRRYGLNLDL